MKHGKLIVIEAGDGAGKATQTELLYKRLDAEKYDVRRVSFPDYESAASGPIKMYLGGEFGQEPGQVNPYAAATFYAVDRYASFQKHWREFYESGGIVLADRYVPSNMAHQAVKIDDPAAKKEFLAWLDDLEYNRLSLPRPDTVIFLDMEPAVAQKLRRNRADKVAGDIHEQNENYLSRCYEAYQKLTDEYKWHRIICSKNGEPLSTEQIHAAVYSAIKSTITRENQ